MKASSSHGQFMPDTFALLIAFGPLALYFAILGIVSVSGWTWVGTSTSEVMALGLAVVGLVAIGPAELFFPRAAAAIFGPVVWIAVLTLYLLCVTLFALTRVPRLSVFGRTSDDLFDALFAAAKSMDSEAVEDKGTMQIHLPQKQLRLRIEGYQGIAYAQVIAFEPDVPIAFWMDLQRRLKNEIRRFPITQRSNGLSLLFVALAIAIGIGALCVGQADELASGLSRWLYRV